MVSTSSTSSTKGRSPFEYAPAPESRAIVDIKPSYGLFINGEFVDGHGRSLQDDQPGDRGGARRGRRGRRGRRRPAVKAARRAYTRVWGRMPGTRARQVPLPDRPDHPGARPRAGRAGVDRQRQADQGDPRRRRPDRRGALLLLRRLGRQARVRRLRHPRASASPAQVIPWNFPLLMLAWKIAPALACGNTVVLKPAETTPLTALLFAEICQQADLPPGRRQHRHRRRRHRPRRWSPTPTSTRSPSPGRPRSARRSPSAVAGTDKRVTLELGGKAANIVFDDAPLDQAVEGIVNGIFFNQGHVCCAGSRLLVQESVADEVLARLKRRMATLRVGDPLDKNTDIGAINSAEQLAKIRELSEIGEQEGAGALVAAVRAARPRLLVRRRRIFTGVTQAHRIAREEIFGPVLSVLTFRTPAEAIEKANNTPYGLSAGVWTDKGSTDPVDGRRPARRRRLGQHVQQVRPGQPVRRLQGVGLRPRGRPPRPGGLPRDDAGSTSARPTSSTSAGDFPRSESGRSYVVDDAQGPVRRQRRAGLPQGRPRRGGRRAQGVPRLVRPTAYNRGQVLYRVAEVMEGRRPQFVDAVRQGEGGTAAAAGKVVDARSTAWSGTPAGPTRSPRSSATPTRSPARSSTSPRPSRPVSSPCWRPAARACSAWSAWSRR